MFPLLCWSGRGRGVVRASEEDLSKSARRTGRQECLPHICSLSGNQVVGLRLEEDCRPNETAEGVTPAFRGGDVDVTTTARRDSRSGTCQCSPVVRPMTRELLRVPLRLHRYQGGTTLLSCLSGIFNPAPPPAAIAAIAAPNGSPGRFALPLSATCVTPLLPPAS
jgi:hypothetical protein